MALFTPAPAYHYVTPLKMFVSCVVLFYYLPSPFLLFSDGWEEREEIGRIWGALTDEKRMEIEVRRCEGSKLPLCSYIR